MSRFCAGHDARGVQLAREWVEPSLAGHGRARGRG